MKAQHKVDLPSHICLGELLNPFVVLQDSKIITIKRFFRFIGMRNENTNEVYYKPENKSEQQMFSRIYKELFDMQLLVRVKPAVYLINPNALLPTFSEYEKVNANWEALINKANQKRKTP